MNEIEEKLRAYEQFRAGIGGFMRAYHDAIPWRHLKNETDYLEYLLQNIENKYKKGGYQMYKEYPDCRIRKSDPQSKPRNQE